MEQHATTLFNRGRRISGDATSTKVTFHTPPYAAIEQYVKTYAQGPWTDVYALGVVLHECVTGEKPPEVLERMHGGLGQPLADGEWPGYSRTFLRAVDAAMIIRPAERPQSISEWLALFTASDAAPAKPASFEFDEPTRFVPFEALPEKIVPVAPPPPDFEAPEEIATPVPENTSEVQFKRAGRDTTAGKTQATEAQFLEQKAQTDDVAEPVEAIAEPEKAEVGPDKDAAEPTKAAPANEPAKLAALSAKQAPAKGKVPSKKAATTQSVGKPKSGKVPLLIGAGFAVVAAIGGGAYFAGLIPVKPAGGPTASSVAQGNPVAAPTEAIADVPVVSGEFAQAIQSLAGAARQSGAPAGAVAELAGAGGRLAAMQAELPNLTGPASAARGQEIATLAKSASVQFAAAIGRDTWGRMQKLARDHPWADPRRPGSARGEPALRQRIAQQIGQAQAGVAAAIASTTCRSCARRWACPRCRPGRGCAWHSGSLTSGKPTSFAAMPGKSPRIPTHARSPRETTSLPMGCNSEGPPCGPVCSRFNDQN